MNNHNILYCDVETHAKTALVALALVASAIAIACNVSVKQETAAKAQTKTPAIIHLTGPKNGPTPVKQYISPPPSPMPPIENEPPSRPEKVITRGFAGLSAPSIARA